jgi:formamidopyrimidine-DNA glycosylase
LPELPDVEGYRRTLETRALGTRICAVEVPDPAVLRNASPAELSRLAGRSFTSVVRIGKWLVAGTSETRVLFHFGMTGRLEWVRTGVDDGRYVRLRFAYRDGALVYRDPRRLRGVWLLDDDLAVKRTIGPIGPDALGLAYEEFDSRLARRRGAIKAALMDQHVVAGIGNMVADEVLWRAHTRPRDRYADLDEVARRRLHRQLTRVLDAAAKIGEIPRTARWLSSQRGAKDPRCPRCHGELHAERLGARTAYWCPVCQPAPE